MKIIPDFERHLMKIIPDFERYLMKIILDFERHLMKIIQKRLVYTKLDIFLLLQCITVSIHLKVDY